MEKEIIVYPDNKHVYRYYEGEVAEIAETGEMTVCVKLSLPYNS